MESIDYKDMAKRFFNWKYGLTNEKPTKPFDIMSGALFDRYTYYPTNLSRVYFDTDSTKGGVNK